MSVSHIDDYSLETKNLSCLMFPLPVDQEKITTIPFLRIVRLNSPEWMYILFGSLCAMLIGIIKPGFGLILAHVTAVSIT